MGHILIVYSFVHPDKYLLSTCDMQIMLPNTIPDANILLWKKHMTLWGKSNMSTLL
jgi:hypothetical protein